MSKILFIIGLCLSMFVCHAQQTEAEKDILKLMEVNGSEANYDLAFEQIVSQFKMMKPNVPQLTWDMAKREVFDKEIVELNKKLIPVYQKNFAPAEIKQLIEFYQSPLGKKLVDGTMKSWEEKLQGLSFLKVHRTIIVNLLKIDHIEGNLIQIGVHKLPVSEQFKGQLMERMFGGNWTNHI